MTQEERIAAAEAAQLEAKKAVEDEERAMQMVKQAQEAARASIQQESQQSAPMSIAQQRLAAQEAAYATRQPVQEAPKQTMSIAQQRLAAMEAARGGSSSTTTASSAPVETPKEKPKKKGFGFKLRS